jgi:lycopene beta-cyclase
VHDVAIVGGGPAALALASACAGASLRAVVVAPPGSERWAATYGTWVDDLDVWPDAAGLRACLATVWPVVRLVGAREHRLHRAYARFDNGVLAAHLWPERAARVQDRVLGVRRDGDVRVLELAGGGEVVASLVVDATGSSSVLVGARCAAGVQVALGAFLPSDGTVEDGSFTLMDWSDRGWGAPPTFLYSMDLGDGRCLVEETSLVGAPVDKRLLAERLCTRHGWTSLPYGEIEHVSIDMGGALPARNSLVAAFGAAAGYVHPVTGYSIAASLRAAPRVALAIADALGAGMLGDALCAATWRAVWPRPMLATRALHNYGLAAMLRLDLGGIQRFFDAFVSLPTKSWARYLRIDTPPAQIAATMTRFFAALPASMKVRIASTPPWAATRVRRG